MYFNKYPVPANFRYVNDLRAAEKPAGPLSLRAGKGAVTFTLMEDGLLRITSTLSAARPKNLSTAGLEARSSRDTAIQRKGKRLRLSGPGTEMIVEEATGEFEFRFDGSVVLRSTSRPFGVCAAKSIVLLDRPKDTVVYGLGEKTGKLDKSNKSYKMWNADVAFDFVHTFMRDDYDPAYVSIPFYISKYTNEFYGVLLDNPYSTFFHTGQKKDRRSLIPSTSGREEGESAIALGADDGLFEFYIIPGPTLPDVVRRFARLTGRHELPPLWALGYHQCRWGYESAKELAEIAGRLAEEKIPTGAIWADIDYMEGYRVFTYNKKTFSERDRKKCFEEIRSRGTQLVTIVDPGVKAEKGYSVYEEGACRDLFCKTPEGSSYVGYVWPGRTHFPDFTLSETREFWAERIARHLQSGPEGIWLDMNDPSTGMADLEDMRFQGGQIEHAAYHNQYAYLMAMATWEGFSRKDPNARPFILTRSGYTGTQKYSAIWTGDNFSNEDHLAMSIPMSVNLALSGVSFNGPDVGGFAGDTTEDLMVAWMLAGALFPFFRNHSAKGTRSQEPWAFSRRALTVIRNCILTRATLLPYLYNLFHTHWREGDPVIRPVSYEFAGARYERLDDQFMIGPSLLLAPFVQLGKRIRAVELPPGWWFSLQTGRWVEGGRTITVKHSDEMIAFVRDGSILPCADRDRLFPQPDFRHVSFHVFCKQRGTEYDYYEDDGATRDYQQGEFNLYRINAKRKQKSLQIAIRRTHTGMKKGFESVRCCFYGAAPEDAAATTARWPFQGYRVSTKSCPVD